MNERIRSILDKAAVEIEEEVRAEIRSKLAEAVAAIGLATETMPEWKPVAEIAAPAATDGTAANGNGQAKKGRPKRSRRTKGLSEAAVGKMLELVKRNPGKRSEELQGQATMPAATVKAALAKLRATGRVRTRGRVRATTYYPAPTV